MKHLTLTARAIDVADGAERVGPWVGAAIAVAVAVALATLARWSIGRLSRRRDTVTSTVQVMARLVFVLLVAIGLYVGLRIIGIDLAPVLAGAGIAGIALAFGLKDIAENYISGVLMGFRNPFNLGDEIVSGDHEGTVEGLNLRYTTLRTYDGVRVLLPNGQVFKSPLTNLTINGNRRTDFTVGLAYGTDLERATAVLADAVASVPGVDAERGTQAWVEELAGSWVVVRVRYWHPPRIADVWRVRSAAIIAATRAAAQAGIEMPYETTVVRVADGGRREEA